MALSGRQSVSDPSASLGEALHREFSRERSLSKMPLKGMKCSLKDLTVPGKKDFRK